MKPALQKAIATIMQALGEYEQGAMTGGAPGTEAEAPGDMPAEGEEAQHACPECAAGTCENPDHASNEEYDQMMT